MTYDTKPTAETYQALQDAYDHFNHDLFDGSLPPCLIVLHRKRGAVGYFWAGKWRATAHKDQYLDEISLTPDGLDRGDLLVLSTLAHEMVHLWQQHKGKPSRSGYHNKEWAAKMREIGLQPESVPGGRETGQRCTHVILVGDRFELSAQAFLANRKVINWYGLAIPTNGIAKKNKTVYVCSCGNKVWGKPDMNIVCGDCEEPYAEQ